MPFCHLCLRAQRPKSSAYPKEIRTLGDHIRKKRLHLGLLQRQVAEQIGVDEATIWNWESNATAPAIRLIPRIIRFLDYDPLPTAEDFGERLKAIRRRLGMSQKELAKRLGADPSTIGDWEEGKHPPSKSSRERIESSLSKLDSQSSRLR